ncbi:MAG: hypothetical protein ACE5IA_04885 [Dehalococcoidia bacterium]
MFHCVGCGAKIDWDGRSGLSYTCPCGATIFAHDQSRALTYPSVMLLSMARGRALPHLEYLVGASEHSSPEKERVVSALRGLGFTSVEECERCQRDGGLERYQRYREFHQRRAEVRRRVELGELSPQEGARELEDLLRRLEGA